MADRAQTLGVVVPTIGDRPELRRLLLSVAGQTRRPDSVCVVVDSRDTAMSTEIVDGIRQEMEPIEVSVVSTGVDRGTGDYLVETGYGCAVNVGLSNLDTDLVSFLDDDDEILPDHYSNLEAALDAHHDIGLAYSRVEVVSVDGRRRHFQSGELPGGRFSAYTLMGAHPVLLPATLIRRSLIDRIGHMDETLDRKADTDMLVRLGGATEFAAVDEPTYVYYRNPHGSDVHDRALEEMYLLIGKHRDHMSRREQWLSWDSLTRSALKTGLTDLARNSARQAIATWVSTAPGWLVSLYVRVRSLDVPHSIRRTIGKLRNRGR
jgi:glycosyltransferase involved in cell wall biosynthesis